MARITIEDCIEKVPNRFRLVQMATIRAKQLKKGANSLVKSEDNKAVVVALREIAAGLVTPDRPLETDELAALANGLPPRPPLGAIGGGGSSSDAGAADKKVEAVDAAPSTKGDAADASESEATPSDTP
jgi:DNA-directed RNA polymerase subunit omega